MNRKLTKSLVAVSLLFSTLMIPVQQAVKAAERGPEITNYRTEMTRTYRNSDLTETIEVFPFPVFEKNETDGKWIAKDLTTPLEAEITTVAQGEPDQTFSGTNSIEIGTDENGEYRTYIQFGEKMPTLENKFLLSAKLKLYERNNTFVPDYYNTPLYQDESYAIHKINTAWDARGLTWNNQPEVSELPYANKTDKIYKGGPVFTWDVSSLVKEWYEQPESVHGLAIKSTNPTSLLRSFYGNSSSLNIIPVLQITYQLPPTVYSALGWGLGSNTGMGSVALNWHSVSGAKGYKVLFFNGKEYESIDVGNVTAWSTAGKNLWPTKEQISNGEYKLRLDGSGTNLSDDPSPVYKNAGYSYPYLKNYRFKIQAYNEFGSANSEEKEVRIPDQTAPNVPQNVRVTNELYNDFTIEWDPATDAGGGNVAGYFVKIKMTNGTEVNRFTDSNNIKNPLGDMSIGSTYYISVQSVDGNQYTSNYNYSLHSESIQAKARITDDAIIANYAMPYATSDVLDIHRVKITFVNEGVEDWTAEKGYELRAKEFPFVYKFGPSEIVKSGEQKTLEFILTGDKQIGEWPLTFQMYNVNTGWFGDSVTTKLNFVDRRKPELTITNPAENKQLSGIVEIKGRVQDYSLLNYSLAYRLFTTEEWQPIFTGTTPVADGLLANWDTKGIPKGFYNVRLSAVDTSGNTQYIDRWVYVNIPPEWPTVNPVGDNAITVTGRAKPGTTILVKKSEMVLGNAETNSSGDFSITLSALQPTGTVLTITATDLANNTSEPTIVTVIDKTPPTTPKINPVGDSSTTITGTAEKGSTIKVSKGPILIGSGTVKPDGIYSITIAKQGAGTVLAVTATDAAQNISGAAVITVLDKTAPALPVVNGIGDNSKTVTGSAEKGAVIAIKKGTTLIATGTVDVYGKYNVSIPLQKAGTILTVTATDKARNTSTAATKTVVDKTAPAIPTVNTVYSYHTTVKGKAEPSSTVTVKRGTMQLGYAKADSKGNFTVKIARQKRYTLLSITAKDNAGNVSGIRQMKVK